MEKTINRGGDVNDAFREIFEYSKELECILRGPKKEINLQMSVLGVGIDIPIRVNKYVKANMVFPVFLYGEVTGKAKRKLNLERD